MKIILSFPCTRESSNFNPFWIPAGVYPDENRGRNDSKDGNLIIPLTPPSPHGGEGKGEGATPQTSSLRILGEININKSFLESVFDSFLNNHPNKGILLNKGTPVVPSFLSIV